MTFSGLKRSFFFCFRSALVVLVMAAVPLWPASSIIVEKVETGTVGERAGFLAGDRLVAWTGDPGTPGKRVPFASVFDWYLFYMDRAQLGPVYVEVARESGSILLEVKEGTRGVIAMPELAPSAFELYNRGQANVKEKDLEGGLKAWDELAVLVKSDPNSYAWIRLQAAQTLSGSYRPAEAAAVLEPVVASLAGAETLNGRLWILWKIGDYYSDAGEYDRASGFYLQTEEIVRTYWNDSLVMASILNSRGILSWKAEDLEEAKRFYTGSLEIKERLAPGSSLVASTRNNLGILAWRDGELDTAAEHCRVALDIYRTIEPGSMNVFRALYNLALLARSRGKLDESESFLLEARELIETSETPDMNTARIYNSLGVVEADRGQLARAVAYYEAALDIFHRLDPGSLLEAQTLNSLGIVARKRGELDRSQAYYEQTLAIYRKKEPENPKIAYILNNLGILTWNRGNLVEAEKYYRQALELARDTKPEGLVLAGMISNLGILARQRGNLEEAERYHREALALRREVGPGSLDVAESISNLGGLERQRGNLDLAEALFSEALEVNRRQAPGSLMVAQDLSKLGDLAMLRGDFVSAGDLFKEALEIRRAVAPGGLDEAISLAYLGELAALQDQWKEAETCFLGSLAIRARLAPGTSEEAESLHWLGKLKRKENVLEEALDYFRRAVEALESQRAMLGGGKEAMEKFSARHAEVYRDLIGVQLELDRAADAFHTLERYRARSLLEMMAERDLVFRTDIPAGLQETLTEIHYDYDRIQQELAEVNAALQPETAGKLMDELNKLKARRADIHEKIREAVPRLGALKYPEPVSLEQAGALFDRGTLFLSYCVGSERTYLFSLLNGKLKVATIPLGRQALERRIRQYRTLIMRPESLTDQLRGQARDLFDTLVAPVSAYVKKADRLVICPDGPLHYLPFASLVDTKGQYLVERVPVARLASATVYKEGRKPAKPRPGEDEVRLVAFGDPVYPGNRQNREYDELVRSFNRMTDLSPLPGTRVEVERLGELFGDEVRVYLGDEAREETVKALPGDVTYLHFACHGVFNEDFPLDSGLVLTLPQTEGEGQDNGILQAWEIFESVRIEADLVTLSACQTGLGKEMGGEGLIGLTRAFSYAGARAVMASLWSVADDSTSELMVALYRGLKKGETGEDALRKAQRSLMESETWSHPFYWATFVLHLN